mmetsp:Transcript_69982/g.208562  ORF Transcript_69982/g.208562 Transcript_69982/m.208562 type:complete len:277 (+) Transcript_69982:737-1567(+)
MHRRRLCRRYPIDLQHLEVPYKRQEVPARLRAPVAAAARRLPRSPPGRVVPADAHGGGVRAAPPHVPRPAERLRGPPGRRHPAVLRHKVAHARGEHLAGEALRDRLLGLLRPVPADDLLLQRPPEDGGADRDRPHGPEQPRPLRGPVQLPLPHAWVYGTLDAGATPQGVWHHVEHREIAGADARRGVHSGQSGGGAEGADVGHVLVVRHDLPAGHGVDAHELLPCDHRGRVRGDQREEQQVLRRAGPRHGLGQRLVGPGPFLALRVAEATGLTQIF